MLLLRLWNYMRGYVIILVEGYFLEKFMNICTHRQIFLWDIKKHKNSILTLKISIKGFKLLRPIARKTRCRVRIVRKKGLPFLMSRYRRRKAFMVGAVLFILLIYVLSSFIWAVEITGNNEISAEEILSKLQEIGIKPGVLKYRINPDKAVNHLMVGIEKLKWISISVKGTKLKIHMAERVMPPPLVPSDEPCNIIARRDGMIKSITVKDGIETVQVGDTVTKGQVLVSGAIPIKGEEGKMRLVHAIASIEARTWYERRQDVKTKVIEKEMTGNTKASYTLMVLNKRIDLYKGKVAFENYDTMEIRKRMAIGEDIILPFELVVEKYHEYRPVEKTMSIDEAKKIAADEAYNEVMKEVPENTRVVKSHIDFVQAGDNGLSAVVTIECIEEIGVKEKIGGN